MLLILIGALLFYPHGSQLIFKCYKIPDTLWLIGAGIFLGPVLGLLSPGDFGIVGSILTSAALPIILFEAGLELKLEDLRRSLGGAVLLTALVLTVAIHYIGGFPWVTSLFAGVVAAAPSPPVVIPLLKGLHLLPNLRATITIDPALGEALGLVVALAILRIASLGHADVGETLGVVMGSFVVAGFLALAFGVTRAFALVKVRQGKNAMILTPSLVFIVFGLTEFMGFSGPVVALVFGFVLANAAHFLRQRHQAVRDERTILEIADVNAIESRFLKEFVPILKTFFFVFPGLSMRPGDLWSATALAVVGILFLMRMFAIRVCLGPEIPDARTGTLLGSMIPRGLAAAVLAAAASHTPGLAGGDEIDNLLYAVILFSIVAVAVMIFLIERTGVSKLFRRGVFKEREAHNP